MKLRIANCELRIFPPPPREREEGWKFEIRNSKFDIFAAAIFLIGAMLWSTPAAAKLAVFVDGRVLKVADARLEGSEIVLELKGGGIVRVPAVRIDRVIADEVEENTGNGFGDPDCPFVWSNEPLPRNLPFKESVTIAARAADLHPWLVAVVVQTESAFDPHAVSRAGAAGLMQLMPAAAADQGVNDVFDPADNALAAYNAGATTVERYDGIPPYKETRDYVRKVLERFCPEEQTESELGIRN